MTRSLNGLRVVVTGGASGIGLATAGAFAQQGAQVVVFDLAGAVDRGVPAPLRSLAADVTDDAAVTTAVAGAVELLGGIDVLVNNAGIGAQGTVADNDLEEWRRVFDVNVFGAVRVSRAALPHLRQSDSAAIVNVCSVAATAGLPQRALYSATKGAIGSLTLAMAADHLREGIRVNCVNPGTADTPWVGRLLESAADPAAERAALEARQPQRAAGECGRGCRSHPLPGIAGGRLHDRCCARRGRRHAEPAPPATRTTVVAAAPGRGAVDLYSPAA